MACHFVEAKDRTYQGKTSKKVNWLYFIYMFLVFVFEKSLKYKLSL